MRTAVPGVTLSTTDSDIGDPVKLYATDQPLGELALAREGAARQIDVVGTRKTDHSEITYYQEKEGGAYQDHWAKKQRELEKERGAVLA